MAWPISDLLSASWSMLGNGMKDEEWERREDKGRGRKRQEKHKMDDQDITEEL